MCPYNTKQMNVTAEQSVYLEQMLPYVTVLTYYTACLDSFCEVVSSCVFPYAKQNVTGP